VLLLIGLFDGKYQMLWLLTPALVEMCLAITEALEAPTRTTWRFFVRCSTDDEEVGVVIISEKEMSPHPVVI
jgi:hypothetical protein